MDIIRSILTIVFILAVGLALVAVADVLFGEAFGRGSYLKRRARARAALRAQRIHSDRTEAKAVNRNGHG